MSSVKRVKLVQIWDRGSLWRISHSYIHRKKRYLYCRHKNANCDILYFATLISLPSIYEGDVHVACSTDRGTRLVLARCRKWIWPFIVIDGKLEVFAEFIAHVGFLEGCERRFDIPASEDGADLPYIGSVSIQSMLDNQRMGRTDS